MNTHFSRKDSRKENSFFPGAGALPLFVAALCVLTLGGTSCVKEELYLEGDAEAMDALYEEFVTPPSIARPLVWWHWMNGNITLEGIRKDLLWMDRAGIAGFHHFDAGLSTPQIVDRRLTYMDEGWKGAFRYAIQLADSLGMEVGIASAPGWSATGGPWVEKKDAMKKLTWREVDIVGGKRIDMDLPAPFDTTGPFQDLGLSGGGFSAATPDPGKYYEDICVIAVRLPEEEKSLTELGAVVSSSGGTFTVRDLTDGSLSTGGMLPKDGSGYAWIQYSFPEERTFCSLSLVDGRTRGQWANEEPTLTTVLQKSSDGVSFSDVVSIPSGGVAMQTITFSPTTARYFRLKVKNPQAQSMFGFSLDEPEGSFIGEFNLFCVPRVNHSEEKSGFAAPHDLHKYFTEVRGQHKYATGAIDITSSVKRGRLRWTAPEGRWRVYRFGYSLTGKTNHPAPPEATGLEVDKLDPVAWGKYLHTYLDMYKEASGGLLGKKGIQYMLTDSYEAEQQTWTPAMASEFKKRRGYDLMPYLPVLAGMIVDSPEVSEKFLMDWRMTIGELIAENYDLLGKIVKEDYGMKGRYTESHENGRVYVVDGMDVKKGAEFPMSACWVPNPVGGSSITMAQADIRESASTAHIFGQNMVAAESLTAATEPWGHSPRTLKKVADTELASGLNRFVIHESAHQPSDDHVPGVGLMVFGQWFNRHETWAEDAKLWTDYMARSCYLLQQGTYSADILIFYGEDTNVTAEYGTKLPSFIPRGYSYDFVNPTAVKTLLSVSGGKITTPSGMQYSLIYLTPNCSRMSLGTLRALEALSQKGAVICGTLPTQCASLGDDPEEFKEVASRLAKGGVALPTLQQCIGGTVPDLLAPPSDGIRFVHRHLPTAEIYWVNKPSADRKRVTLSIKGTGRKPEVWHPDTGERENVQYRMENGRTFVDVDMVEDDALFIVLGTPTDETSRTVPTKQYTPIMQIEGPWKVSFQKGRGAPEGETTFSSLHSLSEDPSPGIRYFSGTATYTTTFTLEESDKGAALDLGDVRELCHVKVNGKEVATLWKPPYRVDLSEVAKVGENTLEVSVTSLWPNRIIGDAVGAGKKITYTHMSFYGADSPLLPSGLLGPVKIEGQL